jgi:hypothetical protein
MGRCFVLAILAVVGANTLALAQTLKREPPMGSLREGQRVLVDDSSCGSGKIKEVVGGNHVTVGGTKQLVRQRRCIPKG